jgi:hypothetical protein
MNYALIKNGLVEQVIVSDAEFAQSIARKWDAVTPAIEGCAIGWAWDGEAFTPPAPPPAPEPTTEPRHITRLAFLNRFTDAEAISIDLASIGATEQAAGLRRYMNKVNAATFIDLARPDTRAGVQALEAGGVLAAGRAAEILDSDILDEERP